jgi:hypothetical protein
MRSPGVGRRRGDREGGWGLGGSDVAGEGGGCSQQRDSQVSAASRAGHHGSGRPPSVDASLPLVIPFVRSPSPAPLLLVRPPPRAPPRPARPAPVVQDTPSSQVGSEFETARGFVPPGHVLYVERRKRAEEPRPCCTCNVCLLDRSALNCDYVCRWGRPRWVWVFFND